MVRGSVTYPFRDEIKEDKIIFKWSDRRIELQLLGLLRKYDRLLTNPSADRSGHRAVVSKK